MTSSNNFYDETIASHFLASEAHRHESSHRAALSSSHTNANVELPPLQIYVFPRENNKLNWIVIGFWAKLIASEQMRSASLVRSWTYDKINRPITLPALVINSDATYRDSIKDALLNKAVSVVVLEKNARSNAWTISMRGSPGLPGDFENVLYNDPNAGAEALAAVTCAILLRPTPANTQGQLVVSLAMVSTSQRNLWFGEFEDNFQFQLLDSTLTQWAAKEIYVDATAEKDFPDAFASLKRIVARSAGLCMKLTPKNEIKAFENQPETTIRKLEQVIRIPQKVDTLSDYPSCRTALGILVGTTNLTAEANNSMSTATMTPPSPSSPSSQQGRNGFYNLFQFTADHYVRLDTAAVDALNIISRGGSEKMTITTNSGDATAAPQTTTVPISIFGWLNQCSTASGSRMMRQWLLQPLRDREKIVERQNIVQALIDLPLLRSALAKDVFGNTGNMDALNRKLQRHSASLKDVHSLLGFVESIPRAIHLLKMHAESTQHETCLTESFLTPLEDHASTFHNLRTLIVSTIQVTHTGQHIIVPQFDDNLAETHAKLEEVKAKIDQQFNHVLHKFGWNDKTLKKDANPTYGVHFRVSRQQDQAVRSHQNVFKVLQTTREGVRFTTKELSSLNEDNIILEKEYESRQAELQKKLVETAASYVGVLDDAKELFAKLDVFCAWAQISCTSRMKLVRPEFVDEEEDENEEDQNQQQQPFQATLDFEDLWHPLVEARRNYVSSTVKLGNASESGFTRGWIITGPNMGGKSTFMRSVGVATVLAHCGCFVPAKKARLSVSDAILCRVGAMDYLSSGISTFMAEMLESSAVLSAATNRSLVIVDELGRGTSTFDGFGLAWTIAEEIVINKKALMVFATHFHEMTHIEHTSKGRLVNVHVSAETLGNELLRFLYQIQPGPCDRSFGVQIAQMAGLPENVVAEARKKANELERTQSQQHHQSQRQQYSASNGNNNNSSGSLLPPVKDEQDSASLPNVKTENNTNGGAAASSSAISNADDLFAAMNNKQNGTTTGASSSGFFSRMTTTGGAGASSQYSSGSPSVMSFDGAFGFLDAERRQRLLDLAAMAAKVETVKDIQEIAKQAQEVEVQED